MTNSVGDYSPVYLLLGRLDRGRHAASDVRTLLATDPRRVNDALSSWARPGVLAAFCDLRATDPSVQDCVQFAAAAPSWVPALFLACDGDRGQMVAATLAGARR